MPREGHFESGGEEYPPATTAPVAKDKQLVCHTWQVARCVVAARPGLGFGGPRMPDAVTNCLAPSLPELLPLHRFQTIAAPRIDTLRP